MSKANEYEHLLTRAYHSHMEWAFALALWEKENRAFLESSALLKEAIQEPSSDFIERIATSVVQQRINGAVGFQKAVKITPSLKTLDDVRFTLAALLEVVQ